MDVNFNEQAGELPYNATPTPGTFSWYEDSTGGKVDLSSGVYEYSYQYNVGIRLITNSMQNYVRGILYAKPRDTYSDVSTHYFIPFSESLTMNKGGVEADDADVYMNAAFGMEGRFELTGTTEIMGQIRAQNNTWPTSHEQYTITWGFGEQEIPLTYGGSTSTSSYGTTSLTPAGDVHAYMKIRKVS